MLMLSSKATGEERQIRDESLGGDEGRTWWEGEREGFDWGITDDGLREKGLLREQLVGIGSDSQYFQMIQSSQAGENTLQTKSLDLKFDDICVLKLRLFTFLQKFRSRNFNIEHLEIC